MIAIVRKGVGQWVRLVVLLSVICGGLPIQVANASSQEFTVPKAVVDASVWKAIWRQQYKSLQGVEMTLYSAFLIQLYKNDGATAAPQAISRINDLRTRYEDNAKARPPKSSNEVVRAMFDAAFDTAGLTSTIRSTWVLFVNQGSFPVLDTSSSIAAMTQRFELADSLREREESVLQAALDLAQQNGGFADAYDQLTQADLQMSITNIDAKQMLAAHPAVYVPDRIRNNIGPNGTVSISLDELKGLSQTEFDKLDATLTNLRSALVEVDSKQQSLIDYVKDQKKKEETAAQAKTKAEEEKLAIDARKSAISIISTFIGLEDEKMGKAVSTYLTSGTEIADALATWLEATSKLDGLDKLADMSTIVMTGNVLGAVMNVVKLFGSSGPSMDQKILEGIAKLRKQIDDLHKDMDKRFDRIDRELNVIFTTMQDRFNLIDLQLGKINGNLQEIQQTLIGLELTLNRIERNNYEFLQAGFRRPLQEAINGAINYKARTGADMPYQPDFVNNENVFQTWGTINAFDALSIGPSQRKFTDDQLLAELNSLPLDANINYLNNWLIAHGLTPFATSQLANARDWTFASRAYAQMGLDWPQHMQRISAERQAALDAVGANLESATRHISTLDTSTGPQGNRPLFTGVLDFYKGKLTNLDTALLNASNAFTQEVQASRLQRVQPFNLYGGIDQALTYQPAEFDPMTCGNPATWPFVGAPGLMNVVPNVNRYILADYFKLGTIKVCISADWVDTQVISCNPKLGCKMGSKYQITIDVLFDDVSIERRVLKFEALETVMGSAQSQLIPRWNDAALRARFVADSVSEVPTPELAAQRAATLDKVTTDTQKTLFDLQHELYGKLYNELTTGSLHPTALELSGAKALLDSFITLGLPRAVSDDDLMRSLLFGNERVVEDGIAADTYAISFIQPITQAQIMSDTRIVLNQLATERIDALDLLLGQYLDAIATSAHVESFDIVADARLDLHLAQRMATLPVTSGPGTDPAPKKSIFLPMLNR